MRRRRIAMITFNVVPEHDPTLKYRRLGPLALANHRRYCDRHGYDFIDEVTIDRSRPAAWSKIPAILAALDEYDWVVWADSDTIVLDGDRRLEELADDRYDFVGQDSAVHLGRLGWDPDEARADQPLNAAVFATRSTDRARTVLTAAYAESRFVDKGMRWSGVGDQEAICSALRTTSGDSGDSCRVGTVADLHLPPALVEHRPWFVHLYGNGARHLVPPERAEPVWHRWESAVHHGRELPSDIDLLHWLAIQNERPTTEPDRGGPDRFMYDTDAFTDADASIGT